MIKVSMIKTSKNHTNEGPMPAKRLTEKSKKVTVKYESQAINCLVAALCNSARISFFLASRFRAINRICTDLSQVTLFDTLLFVAF